MRMRMLIFPKGLNVSEVNRQRSRSHNVPEVLHLLCEEVALAELVGSTRGMKSPKVLLNLVEITFKFFRENDDIIKLKYT